MKRLTLLATGVLFTVAGCQSTPEEPREIQVNNQEQKEVTTFDAYEKAKLNYETWLVTLKEAKSLNIYSSGLYEDLLNSWNKAVEIYEVIAVEPAQANESYSLFSSATYSEKFTEQLAEVAEKHTAIMKIKTQADLVLSDSQAQMHYLVQIKAATFFADEYDSLYDDYSELFTYIEDNEIADAQTEQVTFLNKAKALEIKVVLAKYITPLQKELRKFKSEGFHKVAAISYAKAEAEISSASSAVKANTRDLKVIEQAVADAEFELAHVRNISKEVKLLSSVKNDKFEPLVLEFERKLLSVSKALNGSDYRNQPMRIQTELIVTGVNKLHEDKRTDDLETKVALLNTNIEQLELFNTAQAKSLAENKNKIESQVKQLERSEFQIATLQTLLDSYKQQLETKLPDAKAEQVVAKSKEEAAVKPEVQEAAQSKEQAALEPEKPAVVEPKEQAVLEPEKPAVVEAKEQAALEPEKPVVVEPKEQAAVDSKEELTPKA